MMLQHLQCVERLHLQLRAEEFVFTVMHFLQVDCLEMMVRLIENGPPLAESQEEGEGALAQTAEVAARLP